jgi:hypothetical protein
MPLLTMNDTPRGGQAATQITEHCHRPQPLRHACNLLPDGAVEFGNDEEGYTWVILALAVLPSAARASVKHVTTDTEYYLSSSLTGSIEFTTPAGTLLLLGSGLRLVLLRLQALLVVLLRVVSLAHGRVSCGRLAPCELYKTFNRHNPPPH